jgi:hypothetical protein
MASELISLKMGENGAKFFASMTSGAASAGEIASKLSRSAGAPPWHGLCAGNDLV